jgi:hypothetical protein
MLDRTGPFAYQIRYTPDQLPVPAECFHQEEVAMAKLIKYFSVLLPAIVLCIVVFEGSSAASVVTRSDGMPARLQDRELSQEMRGRELNKIIGALESRIKNHHLPEKAKKKLAAMNDQEFRLVKSLCDRMSETGDTAGADFVLLLVTAVIVLS